MFSASNILDRISSLAIELKLANLQPQITACRELMQRHNGIDVAVFGRFKAGKSSFLNHLTGRAVLPIGVVPLTAVITRLRFGETDRAQVRFLNGTTKTIPPGDIGLYVGENENPNNQKQVAAVEVELPELKPLAPLQFVDTPGLGSAFAHNTEVALNWLPNVGAALVAVSADAPLSERDLALLDELRRHTPKIVVLLTKVDLLTEAQRAEVLAFVREQCRRKWQAELPVFFYSNRPALEKFTTELKEQLLTPLLCNRGEAAGQILRHKLASLTARTLDYARVALAAATQAESARAALCEKLAEAPPVRLIPRRTSSAVAPVVGPGAKSVAAQIETATRTLAGTNHDGVAGAVHTMAVASAAAVANLARMAAKFSDARTHRNFERGEGNVP